MHRHPPDLKINITISIRRSKHTNKKHNSQNHSHNARHAHHSFHSIAQKRKEHKLRKHQKSQSALTMGIILISLSSPPYYSRPLQHQTFLQSKTEDPDFTVEHNQLPSSTYLPPGLESLEGKLPLCLLSKLVPPTPSQS